MKRLSVVLLVLCGICGLLSRGLSVQAAPDRVPYVISDNFETGELFGWEAYPYAQDIGYEPFTIPQKEPAHNNSKYSLAKIQKTNDIVELYEGFTKQLDLWTTADTRMKCAVFLMSDRKPADLELSICLLDGRRYFNRIQSPGVNRWLELDIPLNQFIMDGIGETQRPKTDGETQRAASLPVGSHIQAVTIKASYPIVTHLMSYTICIDDFSLNGERQRRFIGVNPTSTTFEMYSYSILNKHFFYGDAIGISVKAEDAPGKGQVSGVVCDLIDPQGKKVVSALPMTSSGGSWTNDKIYTMKRTDPRGQWTINFTGKDSGGNEVAWGFRFLMPGERLTAANHPRLEYSGDDLRKMLADSSPLTKKILAGITPGPDQFKNLDLSGINEVKSAQSEALTGGPYAKGGGVGGPRGGGATRLAQVALSGAERYAFTGDETAGLKAKEALLKLCTFSKWNTDWHEAHGMHMYFPVSSSIIGPAGEAFDLLYPLLTEQDKKAIRLGFMNNAIMPFYRDMVEQNRMPSSLSNHIAVIVTGMIKAATAIYGDDPENPSLEPYLSGILAKTKQLIDRTAYPDGGWGEPTTYQDMACRDLVELLYIIERNYGIDYTTTTNMKDTYLYPLYVTYTNGRYPDFGDISPSYGLSGPVFRWLSYRTKNPYTYYFIQKADGAGRGGMINLLWKPEGIVPKDRAELVPSHMFPVKGNMVMRSDWTDQGTVLVFKCGPNSNHYHYDQGTFQLFTSGEELISDAGHGSYYGLYYPCYTTQPIGHNCMLIDNDPESQVPADYENGVVALRNYPRMLHSFAGWNTDEAEGDLTCVYKGKVQSYTRALLFMKPDILFLLDRVKSPEVHTFSWLFHAEFTDGKSSITPSNTSLDIKRTRTSLHMDILSPIDSNRMRTSDHEENFVQLSSAPGMKDAEFLVVLFPSAKSAPDPAAKPVSTRLNVPGWIGAKVEKGDTVTLALFRNGNSGGTSSVEGFTTDAERFAVVTDKQGNLQRFFLRGSAFGKSGSNLFKSAKPVSASASFVFGGMDVETETEAGTEIGLKTDKAPVSVVVNDAPVKRFKFDKITGMVSVAVMAGHTMIKVR